MKRALIVGAAAYAGTFVGSWLGGMVERQQSSQSPEAWKIPGADLAGEALSFAGCIAGAWVGLKLA